MSSVKSIYLVRHENRFNCAVSDCSLTSDGLFSSQFELPSSLDRAINGSGTKIYCSPTLRTLQTIVFYAKDNNIKIRPDEMIYELIANRIEHYYGKTIPTMVDYNIYNHAQTAIRKAMSQIPDVQEFRETDFIKPKRLSYDELFANFIEDMTECKELLQSAQFMLNSDVHTYKRKSRDHPDILINRVMQDITDTLSLVDGVIYMMDVPKDTEMIFNRFDEIDELLLSADKALTEYDIVNFVDHKYAETADFRIADHIENCIKDNPKSESESIESLQKRIQQLVLRIVSDAEYQNAIYVSHAAPIAAIIVCLCFTMCKKTDALNILKYFSGIRSTNIVDCIKELDTQIKVGKVIKVTFCSGCVELQYF